MNCSLRAKRRAPARLRRDAQFEHIYAQPLQLHAQGPLEPGIATRMHRFVPTPVSAAERLHATTSADISKVSVWWLRLGIEIERIKPGNPQQNGRHERMHLTLKLETTKPAGNNFLQQQAKFDDFIDCDNNERPHQALNMRYPAERYVPSTRPYKGLPDLDYPFHDKTVTVTTCGRICFNRQKINLSVVFAGQSVGIKQVSEHIWLVSFMDYDLGYFDHETCKLEPLDNPFGPKVLPMSPE